MKVEAVIVCINYADFLGVTLPANKKHFDRTVVVTDNNDAETLNVCRENGVECIQTNVFYRDNNNKPNKALGINEGLSKLDGDGWVLQLDADIWLPAFTRQMLEYISLDEMSIYGIDRMMCNSREQWDSFCARNPIIHDRWMLNLDIFPVGKRVVQIREDSFLPIGFFQLWNPSKSGVKTYRDEVGAGFERTDILHVKQFGPRNRRFIPELVCIHLASEGSHNGQNWNGRVSKRF